MIEKITKNIIKSIKPPFILLRIIKIFVKYSVNFFWIKSGFHIDLGL